MQWREEPRPWDEVSYSSPSLCWWEAPAHQGGWGSVAGWPFGSFSHPLTITTCYAEVQDQSGRKGWGLQLEHSFCGCSCSTLSSLNGWRRFRFGWHFATVPEKQQDISCGSWKETICFFSLSSGNLWQNIPSLVSPRSPRAAGFPPAAAAAAAGCAGVCPAGAPGRCRAPEDSGISLPVVPPAPGHSARTAKGGVDTKGRTAKATTQLLLRDPACQAACVFFPSSLLPLVLHLQRGDCFSPMQMKFMAAGAARPVNILWSVKLFYITWILFSLIFPS